MSRLSLQPVEAAVEVGVVVLQRRKIKASLSFLP
jgi:hypothetical protein